MVRLLALLLAALLGGAAQAAGHALIVGVSRYPSLDEQMQLDGPKNDAAMVADYLRQKRGNLFRPTDIRVLADGVPGAGAPIRANIVKAMTDLADKAANGDFVYLHFSGHGSQQPARPDDTSETDGRDELFLPADIGAWNDTVGQVDNALVDDDIGNLIGAIRKKGAFVWVVFDSCHSGTVTRGAPAGEDVRMRKVTPAALGIPQAALDAADRQAVKTRGRGGEAGLVDARHHNGGLVAFYAAQSTEQAPEMRLPQGEDGRKPHGLFTFTLMQILAERPGLSYRRAAQEILQRYAALNMDRPTPLFEGDLDARVFGSQALDEKPQWPLEKRRDGLHIPAGSLSRLSTGAVVALLDSPGADEKQALGYARVVNPASLESGLEPIHYRGKPALAAGQLPDLGYARLVELKLDLALRVARPEWPADADKASRDRLAGLLDRLTPEAGSGLHLTWVAPGQPADLRLAYGSEDGGRLRLLPATGAAAADAPAVLLKGKSDGQFAAALLDNLARVARVVNLLRVGQNLGGGNGALDVSLKVKRKGDGSVRDLSAAAVPPLHAGDEVHLAAINTGRKPVDVNVLFVGSDYAISHWYRERIHPNGRLRTGLFRVSADSLGRERVIVVANVAKPESEVLDLSFLAQKALPKTRGNAAAGLGGLLRQAGFGAEKTRGVAPLGDGDDGGEAEILQFAIDTLAAPEPATP